MNTMTVKLEPMMGTEITMSFKDAIAIAKKLGCYVEFDFNGVRCFSSPNGDPEKGAIGYHRALNIGHKFAHAG